VHIASCAVEDPLRDGRDGLAQIDHTHLRAIGREGRLERWLQLCRQA